MGREIKYTFKSESLNYSLKLTKPIENPKNSQILSLNVAYFRDKLYLLPNLFFQNTIPFWFSIQPEPHAVTRARKQNPSFPCGVLVDKMPIFICLWYWHLKPLCLSQKIFLHFHITHNLYNTQLKYSLQSKRLRKPSF